MIALTFDTWEETYKPIANIFDQQASFDGLLFETYGVELGHVAVVARAYPNCVWTLVDGDGGLYVTAGMRFVNRLGYFITSVPFDGSALPADVPCID